MKKSKLHFRFHNPNSAEVTADYITKLFVEVDLAKLESALQSSEMDHMQERVAAK